MHTHRTRDDRVALGSLLREGLNQSEIAAHLGVNRSTICRELERNSREDGSYHALHADILAKTRRRNAKKAYRLLEQNESLATLVEALLCPLLSPEVIGELLGITHETIYAWIDRSRPDLRDRLPRRGKKRRRYGAKRGQKQGWTKLVRSIEERPEVVNDRVRVGDFEGDTIRGVNGAVLTHTDRTSRYEVLHKVVNEGCDAIYAAIQGDAQLKTAQTITYDRGSGFAIWQMIEDVTGALVFFAHPYSPQERPTNENTNERVRRVHPKGTDFGTVSQADLDALADLMNHTPRKCLGWSTPCARYGKACCVSS